MAFTIQSIAVAIAADGVSVGRFGHDHRVVAIDAAGIRQPRQADGCCGNLARAVADCELVICTAIGGGAAGHLAKAGVRLAVVPDGLTVDEALRRHRDGSLVAGGSPTACTHDHGDGHGHAHGCSGG